MTGFSGSIGTIAMVIVEVLDSLCGIPTFSSALCFLSDLHDFVQIPMMALGIILMDKSGMRPLLLVRRLRNLYCVMELNENNFQSHYIHRFLLQEHA